MSEVTPTQILVAAKRDRLSKFSLIKSEDNSITVKFTDVHGFEKFLPCAIKISKTDIRNRWILDELKVPTTKARIN